MRARILLIEDEKALREMTASILKEKGFEVVQAADGSKGVEILRNSAFDVIVTDLRTPTMDAMGLLGELKKFRKNAGIIVTTGHVTKITLDKSEEMDVTAYLEKPFSSNDLILLINNVLNKNNNGVS